MAAAVPKLHLEVFILIDFGRNGRELSPDGNFVVRVKLVVAYTLDDAGLANAGVAYEDQFKSGIELHVGNLALLFENFALVPI